MTWLSLGIMRFLANTDNVRVVKYQHLDKMCELKEKYRVINGENYKKCLAIEHPVSKPSYFSEKINIGCNLQLRSKYTLEWKTRRTIY